MSPSIQKLPQPSPVAQFLKFSLSTDTTALLPVKQLAAVLKVDVSKITPIPHLPAWVMGIYNWRGEVLWIVDTGRLLAASAWQQQSPLTPRYDILLLEQETVETTERCFLGLLVRQVEGIELLSLDDLQFPMAVSEALAPFLRGYWVNSEGDMLSLLDGAAIFDRMPA